MSDRDALLSFDCFGATCAVHVRGDGPLGGAQAAAEAARERLLDGHRRFTRFELGSELSRLNADVRDVVPVSAEMAGWRTRSTARAPCGSAAPRGSCATCTSRARSTQPSCTRSACATAAS